MMLNEVIKTTKLTRKAIEYYCQQGFVSPTIRDNGYREFSSENIRCLQQISVLRKLGLGTAEIRQVLADPSGVALHRITLRKDLKIQREQVRKSILDKLSRGSSYEEASAEISALEETATITERLLDSFPGYYGRFVCLHFARFLNQPLTTPEQRAAYDRIIAFLDNMPTFEFPSKLREFMDENTKTISAEQIHQMLESTQKAIANPEEFFSKNKEVLDQYLEFKQSEEYANSPLPQIRELFKNFYQSSGYYDIFLPALRELSPAYAEYTRQMEAADKVLMEHYPEAADTGK